MRAFPVSARAVAAVVLAAALSGGCAQFHQKVLALYQSPPPPAPVGALSDPMWKTQEANAEASDFVVHQHEFEYNGVRLNMAGEDHVKQIAARLHAGADVPVLVERSMTSVRPGSQYEYPVNPNPELDLQRREVVARSLGSMGVADAEQRVVVAPAYVPGLKAPEAAAAYSGSLQSQGYGGGGYGGYGGGTFNSFSGFGGFR